jgi:hypothetical protein
MRISSQSFHKPPSFERPRVYCHWYEALEPLAATVKVATRLHAAVLTG